MMDLSVPVNKGKNNLKKVKMKDISTLITKGTSPSTYGYSFEDTGINFFKVESLTKANKIKEDSVSKVSLDCHEKLVRSQIQENDILFSIAGTLGRLCVIPASYLPANTNQALSIIRLEEEQNVDYIYWALQSPHINKIIKQIATTGAQPNLSLKQIENFEVIIPPLKEQQKIAEILSTVDDQIEQTDQLIEKTKELKKGLMQQLLTKGIGHTEFKQTELGSIPIKWEIKSLGEVTTVINGGTPSKSNPEYWDNGNILWITPSDVTKNSFKYIQDSSLKITEKGLKKSSATLLPVGSILMTSRATIGEKSINLKPMATNQGFKSFVCNENLYNEYLYYYIDVLKPLFLDKASGSTFLEISKKATESQLIAVPPLDEQRKIAEILSSIDEEIDGYQKEKAKYEELKKGLMQQLLTGKKRVKV